MSTVLVVDDSQAVRQLLCELLQKGGLTVIEASNGIDAKAKIQAKTPDLVITDLIMPEMNGYELCRWIKSDPAAQKVPVLICSTKDQEFDRYWGMKQGADAYIAKPFQAGEMIKTVKQLLRR
ncbi:MAG: response regulator [Pegethrix bostrychoides GSE-TBD4-15B]|jgi:twitching motility two-component system response regulator PilH|uniref:Response regulator n=1 Tax=Pegethrix bostrychoides GSE-TBD4-15B TaxID=2839662 RepID=A0A951U732_9CYAN|nr:response regulator [Pegethrix bostrychoides GSE-TBD4-15B]